MILDTTTKPVLLATDRCCASAKGSCAARVIVQLTPENAPMLFCGHHWDVSRDAIMKLDPFFVHDTDPDA